MKAARLLALIAGFGLISSVHVMAQIFTTVYNFSGGSDGANPYAGLVLSGSTLYGTTENGGGSGDGSVFAVKTDGAGFTTLYAFTSLMGNGFGYNSDGADPRGRLILAGDTLYGTAYGGGSDGWGTIFQVDTNGAGFTVLDAFDYTRGANPYAGLILSGNTFYGTATYGDGFFHGTVFAVNTDGSGFTALHSFTDGNGYGANFTNSDGGDPQGGLILSGNTLYGTTGLGGSHGKGVVFAVNTDGGGFTTLYNFSGGSDGANPSAGLILSGNTLYGTAAGGGSYGKGTVFAVNADGGGFTTLHDFSGGSDGAYPYAGLMFSGNTLYGTAPFGGNADCGTVFAVNTDGTGFTTLHDFSGGSDGANPYGGLILSKNTLYGTTYGGGSSDNGTVFRLSLGSPPSLLTLANLSSDVYSAQPVGYAGYSYLGGFSQFVTGGSAPAGFAVAAYANSDYSQVVVAFRGTFPQGSGTTLYENLCADWGFAGTAPSETLVQYVNASLGFVVTIQSQSQYANANITLTGHSLGGALAQLVGQAQSLTVVGFNAPGSGQLYAPLFNETLSPGTLPNVNYRIYGDQVSLVGSPLGATTTLQQPAYTFFAAQSDPAAMFVVNAPTFLNLHYISTVIAQLADHAPQVSPAGEPNVIPEILGAAQPTSSISTGLQTTYNYSFVITDSVLGWVIDPDAGTDFLFTEQAGSPSFNSVVLPALPGVSFYDVRESTSGGWSSFQMLQPGIVETFRAGVNGIEFVPVDSDGNAVTATNFLFAASFAATGTFEGSLTQSTVIPQLPPLLKITAQNNQAILSWNTNIATGFTLVAATNLGSYVLWSQITNLPTVISNQNVVAIPMSSGSRFFQLQQ